MCADEQFHAVVEAAPNARAVDNGPQIGRYVRNCAQICDENLIAWATGSEEMWWDLHAT
jgi:hypothetical protein